MASSIALGYSLWQDGMTFNGQLGRQLDVTTGYLVGGTATNLQIQGGVIDNIGGLRVGAGSGMQVTVRAGFAIVPNTSSSLQGGYKVGSMVGQNLTVATSDPTNPRIDLVCIGVNDTGDSTGAVFLEIVTGTPAPSPSVPALPANSIGLATVLVPAGSSSVTSGNVTDVRNFQAPGGGVVKYGTTSVAANGFPGMIAYDIANDRFFHNNGASSNERMKILPWQPMTATTGTNVTLSTSVTTVKSINFTTDGATDIKVSLGYPGIFQATMGTTLITFQFYVDSSEIQQYLVTTRAASDTALAGVAYNGNTFEYTTSPGIGDTPGAGTHTLFLKVHYQDFSGGTGTAPIINGTTANIFWLRCEPIVA